MSMEWRNNTFLSLILRFEIGFVEETNEKFLREKRWKKNLIMQIPTLFQKLYSQFNGALCILPLLKLSLEYTLLSME